jgi:hypothetical protein
MGSGKGKVSSPKTYRRVNVDKEIGKEKENSSPQSSLPPATSSSSSSPKSPSHNNNKNGDNVEFIRFQVSGFAPKQESAFLSYLRTFLKLPFSNPKFGGTQQKPICFFNLPRDDPTVYQITHLTMSHSFGRRTLFFALADSKWNGN